MQDRVIALQGARNFRDLGGYPAEGGCRVRWRALYRSGHLAALTPQDEQTLARLGVARAFDFRGVQERAAEPYRVPGLVQHALTIEPSVAQRIDVLLQAGTALTAELMVELMTELYERLVEQHASRFAELFEHLLGSAGEAPLVFHCTAGKDRTGVAAALLLLALGVPRDVVEQDFLLSNVLHRPPPRPAKARDVPQDALTVLWSVRASYLQHALQVIEQRHGGLQHYLERHIGLAAPHRARLAERYLEPA